MTSAKPKKLSELRKLLESPLDLGEAVDKGEITAESFLDLMVEFPGMLDHFFETDYGKLLEQNPLVIKGLAEEELLKRTVSKHGLSEMQKRVFKKKASGLKVQKTVWNRFRERLEPVVKEFQERKTALDKGISLFLALNDLKKKFRGEFIVTKFYSKPAVEAAFEELIELAAWLNEHQGFYPLVLGGWAVYYYYPFYGSVAVETLFPGKQIADDVLAPFYMARNYQAGGIYEKMYYHEVEKAGKMLKTFLIAVTLNDKNKLHENPRISIPWALAFKDAKPWHFGDVKLRVPSLELLLLYQVKALRDKEFDLKKTKARGLRKDILKEMIALNKREVVALVDFCKTKVNKIKLRKLLQKTRFTKYFQQTMADLEIDLKKDFKL